jgi:hypothetical protein
MEGVHRPCYSLSRNLSAEFVKSIDSRALVKAPVRSKDAAAPTTLPPVRRDRENTSEFIAKKREMFLVSPSPTRARSL